MPAARYAWPRPFLSGRVLFIPGWIAAGKDLSMIIRAVLFDLDNTIYPASSGLMQSIDRRIGEYVQRALGIDEEEAARLRRHYYAEFGTTLSGLRHHHQHIEIEHYLQYVHDIALDAFLASDQRLDAMLANLRARKVVFTNSPHEYAERVLNTLGIAHHFERIFDVRYFDFVGKPEPACYAQVLRELHVAGPQTMLIEDTPRNLPPAVRLGMTTVLIDERAQPAPLADYVVPDVLAAVQVAQRLCVPSLPAARPKRARGSLNGRPTTRAGISGPGQRSR
jgi:putative hydrolase of the HAD superfamily